MRSLRLALAATLVLGCATEPEDPEAPTGTTAEELRSGPNGDACKRSAYNCKLRPKHGQRVLRADGEKRWDIDPAWLAAHGGSLPVVDGNGDEMGRVRPSSLVLNYGQTRRMKGVTWVLTTSSGLLSAGWVPMDAFSDARSLRDRVGDVNAHGAGLAKMHCYAVSRTYPDRLDHFKVVAGATDADSEEPNDYLPVVRANGNIYVNLAFNVPGDALGAPATDIFPAGTKFQRLDVPTWESARLPSLDATLYAKPSGSDAYVKDVGEMKFVYGYVKSTAGVVRYGWVPLDGLDVSTGCPDR